MDTNKLELPQGWFDEDNIATYRKLASAVPEGGTLVELGCWKGRSICSIADIVKERKLNVFLVDNFSGADEEVGKYGDVEGEAAYRVLQANLKEFGLLEYVTPLVMKTEAGVGFVEDIDLLFIDADHSYEGVKADIWAYSPKLRKSSAVIAGHDYYREGVHRALIELLWPVENESTIWYKTISQS